MKVVSYLIPYKHIFYLIFFEFRKHTFGSNQFESFEDIPIN
jgi:hypothetical protein